MIQLDDERQQDEVLPQGAGYRLTLNGGEDWIEGAKLTGAMEGIEFAIASLPVGGRITVEVERRW